MAPVWSPPLRQPIIVYRDSDSRGSSYKISLLHADNLAFADNLGMDSAPVIYRGKLKSEI